MRKPCPDTADAVEPDAGCSVYVRAENEEMTCDDACGVVGGVCLIAWGDQNDTCRKEQDPHGCEEPRHDTICRCALP